VIRQLIDKTEEAIISLLLVAMTLLVFWEVILRFGFGTGVSWGQEATLHLSAWFVLFGVSYGLRVGAHIGVDAFVRMFRPLGQRILTTIAILLSLVYCGLFVYGAWVYLAKMRMIGIELEDIPVQTWLAHGILLVGLVLLSLRLLGLSAGFSASGGILLIVIVLGSIYGGIASPTEAAAVSAVYAFLVSVIGYRDMGPLKHTPWRRDGEGVGAMLVRNSWQVPLAIGRSVGSTEVRRTVLEAAKVSIMLLFIIANAMLFAHVLTTERIPHQIAETIVASGLTPWMFLIVVNLLLLAAGNFMEPSAILLIMAPILFPIATQLGIDPIHLGIIMVVNMEIGMLTPPVGLNLFVTSGIAGESMGWVIKAVLPWMLLLLFFLILITYIPQISLFLPEYLDRLQGYR
jgi:TRAP-type C4-dicarboxylate transport system permease large subunit